MLLVAIALLQSAVPVQSAAAQPAAVPAQDVQDADVPPEPKMKRVCRKVIDPRVNTLAARQTVCKYVPADDPKVAQK